MMDLEAIKKRWPDWARTQTATTLLTEGTNDILALIAELEEAKEEIQGLESALRGAKRVVQLCATTRLREGR